MVPIAARPRELAEGKPDVRARLSNLRSMEKALGALVRQCSSSAGIVRCPLITALKVGV